ncbi:hypothetical protein HNY73_011193 [Argiope bruennichi]|uniref:Uncharacterized protein n=1 Tax=Argiope bruennichi TaxID=94029 RepID=A0A8T0F8E7_ARGBR|nr:hypothetical protein HNY73_011193 [Argiope bruennichi]
MAPMRDRQGENRQPTVADCSKFLADALEYYQRKMRSAPYVHFQLPEEIMRHCRTRRLRPSLEHQPQPEDNADQLPRQGEPNEPLPRPIITEGPGPVTRLSRRLRNRMPRV